MRLAAAGHGSCSTPTSRAPISRRWTLARHRAHRLRAPRRALGRAARRAPPHPRRPQPRVAPPGQRGRRCSASRRSPRGGPIAAAAARLALVMLNRSFYALLCGSRGVARRPPESACTRIHHAVGAASIPAGLADACSRNGSALSAGVRLRGRLDCCARGCAAASPHGAPGAPAVLRRLAEAGVFIQIGANDGKQRTTSRRSSARAVGAASWSSRSRDVFERLRANYGDLDGVALENVAIADREGTCISYVSPEAGRTAARRWSDMFGSLSPDRRSRRRRCPTPRTGRADRDDRGAFAQLRVAVPPPRDRAPRPARRSTPRAHDYEILRQLDFERLRPRVLVYEYCHLRPRAARRVGRAPRGARLSDDGRGPRHVGRRRARPRRADPARGASCESAAPRSPRPSCELVEASRTEPDDGPPPPSTASPTTSTSSAPSG